MSFAISVSSYEMQSKKKSLLFRLHFIFTDLFSFKALIFYSLRLFRLYSNDAGTI